MTVSKTPLNGNLRWAVFGFTLIVTLVSVVLYVADARADVDRNTEHLQEHGDVDAEFLETDKQMLESISRLERRLLYLMQHVGIKPADIPD